MSERRTSDACARCRAPMTEHTTVIHCPEQRSEAAQPGPCMASLNDPPISCNLRHGHAGGHESKDGVSWTEPRTAEAIPGCDHPEVIKRGCPSCDPRCKHDVAIEFACSKCAAEGAYPWLNRERDQPCEERSGTMPVEPKGPVKTAGLRPSQSEVGASRADAATLLARRNSDSAASSGSVPVNNAPNGVSPNASVTPKCVECGEVADVMVETNGSEPVYACEEHEVEVRCKALRAARTPSAASVASIPRVETTITRHTEQSRTTGCAEQQLWVEHDRQCLASDPHNRHYCTIEKGHPGAHVACDPMFGNGGVLGAWPGTGPSSGDPRDAVVTAARGLCSGGSREVWMGALHAALNALDRASQFTRKGTP